MLNTVIEEKKITIIEERIEIEKIMAENGYRNGYGTRVMKDDIDPENDIRP